MEHEDGLASGGYDFGDRIYDPRIARWLAIDPKFRNYVPISPYAFVINNPISLIDIDGGTVYDGDTEVEIKIDAQTGSATYQLKGGGEVSDHFKANGQVIINAMIQTARGQRDAQDIIDMPAEVKMIYDQETPSTDKTSYGETKANHNYSKITMVIYKNELLNKQKRWFQAGGDLTSEEEGIGAAAVHEKWHWGPDQRKKELKYPKTSRQSFWKHEETPLNAEYDYRKEYREKKYPNASKEWENWYKSPVDATGESKPVYEGLDKENTTTKKK